MLQINLYIVLLARFDCLAYLLSGRSGVRITSGTPERKKKRLFKIAVSFFVLIRKQTYSNSVRLDFPVKLSLSLFYAGIDLFRQGRLPVSAFFSFPSAGKAYRACRHCGFFGSLGEDISRVS